VIEDQITKERRSDWCHFLINAAGILNNWKSPTIKGLRHFARPKMHSARWDWSVDYKDKTVGGYRQRKHRYPAGTSCTERCLAHDCVHALADMGWSALGN
jgi:hypothetical protein